VRPDACAVSQGQQRRPAPPEQVGGQASSQRVSGKPLPREFYMGPTIAVAQRLLGKLLIHEAPEGRVSGYIVETEAYLEGDPASHAVLREEKRWVTKMTARNRQMFGPPGHAYVYFIYGNHYCLNVVTREEGVAEAVLIRALEPAEGIALMRQRRETNVAAPASAKADRSLANGPGKLAQAFGINGSHNGADLTSCSLRIECGREISSDRIEARPRVGIKSASDKPWRFIVSGSPWISRP